MQQDVVLILSSDSDSDSNGGLQNAVIIEDKKNNNSNNKDRGWSSPSPTPTPTILTVKSRDSPCIIIDDDEDDCNVDRDEKEKEEEDYCKYKIDKKLPSSASSSSQTPSTQPLTQRTQTQVRGQSHGNRDQIARRSNSKKMHAEQHNHNHKHKREQEVFVLTTDDEEEKVMIEDECESHRPQSQTLTLTQPRSIALTQSPLQQLSLSQLNSKLQSQTQSQPLQLGGNNSERSHPCPSAQTHTRNRIHQKHIYNKAGTSATYTGDDNDGEPIFILVTDDDKDQDEDNKGKGQGQGNMANDVHGQGKSPIHEHDEFPTLSQILGVPLLPSQNTKRGSSRSNRGGQDKNSKQSSIVPKKTRTTQNTDDNNNSNNNNNNKSNNSNKNNSDNIHMSKNNGCNNNNNTINNNTDGNSSDGQHNRNSVAKRKSPQDLPQLHQLSQPGRPDHPDHLSQPKHTQDLATQDHDKGKVKKAKRPPPLTPQEKELLAIHKAKARGDYYKKEILILLSDEWSQITNGNIKKLPKGELKELEIVYSKLLCAWPDQVQCSSLRMPKSIQWKRRNFDPQTEKVSDKEDVDHVIIWMSAVEFCKRAHAAENDPTSLRFFAKQCLATYPDESVVFLVSGLEKFRIDENMRMQRFIGLNASRTVAIPCMYLSMTAHQVTEIMTDLFMDYGIQLHVVKDALQAGEYVADFTETLAKLVYKKESVCEEIDNQHAAKDIDPYLRYAFGDRMLERLYVEMLCQIPQMTQDAALGVFMLYPSVRSLCNAFAEAERRGEDADLLLQDTATVQTLKNGQGISMPTWPSPSPESGSRTHKRRVGPQLSRRIHAVFCSPNSKVVVNR